MPPYGIVLRSLLGGKGKCVHPLQSDDPSRLGDYRLLAKLGAGGMGQVYLARSPGGRTVAIKVVRPELAGEEGFRARFRREVAAARMVSGAYTAPVVDADPDAAVPWLATAYVAGPSLVDAVAAHGPLPEPTVRTLAAGLAEALQAVHGAGLVHRDLKPSNVLLALDGPRLIDFGISRAADDTSITSTGLVIGSPGYMSPEQADGQDIGPPSDFFSLASVLVFAATGQGPFGVGSTPSLLYRIVHTPPDLAAVPGYLRTIVEPFLEKDPARRPGSAALAQLALPEGQTTEFLTRSGWLPPAITYSIAERSAALLDLDAATGAGSPAVPPPTPSAPPAPPAPPTYAPSVGRTPPPPDPATHGVDAPPPVQAYPPPQGPPSVHEQPTPAGAFPPPSAGYGPPPTPYGAMPPPLAHPPGPAVGGADRPAGQGAPNRRALLIGGAVASVAAVGGVTAWLLTKSDGKDDGDQAGNSGRNPTDDPTGPAQGGDSGSAAGKPLYKIGFQGGLSGENAQLGFNELNGVMLAVEQANQRGDLGFRLEHVSADDQASETKSAPAAQRLIDDDEVIAVVGPVFSSPLRAAAPLYESANLPLVTPSATNPELTKSKYSTFNRAAPNDYGQGADIAAYLKQLGVTSVHLVSDKSSYGVGVIDAVKTAIGGSMKVSSADVPSKTPDYTAAATEAKNSGAGALVYGGYYQDAGLFAIKLAEAGFTGHRIGPDGVCDDGLVRVAGAAAEGWFCTAPPVDAKLEPAYRDFATAYQGKFQTPPGTYSVEAFEVANLIIEAIKSLGSQKPTRSAMVGAIRSTRYQAPLKEYAFDRATGEFAGTGGTYGYQIKNQKLTYVGNIHAMTSGKAG